MRARIESFLGYALSIFCVLAVFFYGFMFFRFHTIATSMIFPWTWFQQYTMSDSLRAIGAEHVIRIGEKGRAVSILTLPSPERADGWGERAIIYFHGNAENLSTLDTKRLIELHDLGWTVVTYDYPGYGESTGSPVESQQRENIVTVLHYLHAERSIPQERIVYFGYSAGTAISLLAASISVPERIFLLSGFSSDRAMAEMIFGFDMYALFFDESMYPNDQILAKLDIPIAVVHGYRDNVVPFEVGESLFLASKRPDKRFTGIDESHAFDLFASTAGDGARTFFR